jgi:glucokinase
MSFLGIDLGGTKLALALFTSEGEILKKEITPLDKRAGSQAGSFIIEKISGFIEYGISAGNKIEAIGVSVPGIFRSRTGTVWAPSIKGWDDYPLLKEIKDVVGDIPVKIDNDRACYILGEVWKGNARGCKDAIFLSVGTGIGAGILINGDILQGSGDISGCIGWMSMLVPFKKEFKECGCFEYFASGEGIARMAKEALAKNSDDDGILSKLALEKITSRDVFDAYKKGDKIAAGVILQCVEFWGVAVANLVSLFNPEKIIFGGGVFGPALPLLHDIYNEALKWAQPVAIKDVILTGSELHGDAGLYGAGHLAIKAYFDR